MNLQSFTTSLIALLIAIIISILTALACCLKTVIIIVKSYAKIILDINDNKKYVELALYDKLYEKNY